MSRILQHCRIPFMALALAAPFTSGATGTASAGPSAPAAPSVDWQAAVDAALDDLRWTEAERILRGRLAEAPGDADAWRSLGSLLTWSGRPAEARNAYRRAVELDADSTSAVLGLAAAHRHDRQFANAEALYSGAAAKWPEDAEVKRAVAGFRREQRPRLLVSRDDDLSFRNSVASLAVPLGGGHELLLEREEEERPQQDVRTDNKVGYTRHFGLNHYLEARARFSTYDYQVPVSDFSAIDAFQEYRFTYRRPITPAHQVTLRYTLRPTTLLGSGAEFTSHKVEATVRSQWTPRIATTLGTGRLRDLASGATTTSQQANNDLVRLGVELRLTPRLDLGVSYITNPDLDNSVDATTLLQASLDVGRDFSAVMRIRADDYRRGDDQSSVFLGARYYAGGHLWAELGAKRSQRGDRQAVYPVGTLVYRF